MTQLEKDLRVRIHERLMRWMNDSLDLFDMAELPDELAMAATMETMMRVLATSLTVAGVDADASGHLLAEMMKRRRLRATAGQ